MSSHLLMLMYLDLIVKLKLKLKNAQIEKNIQSVELNNNDFNFKENALLTSRSPMAIKSKLFSQQLVVDERKPVERRKSFLHVPQTEMPKHQIVKRSVTLHFKYALITKFLIQF